MGHIIYGWPLYGDRPANGRGSVPPHRTVLVLEKKRTIDKIGAGQILGRSKYLNSNRGQISLQQIKPKKLGGLTLCFLLNFWVPKSLMTLQVFHSEQILNNNT